jgi:thioredoxin reductase
MYDCVIVGGGPAGLSAALMLGRARRTTLVLDAGEPRNAASRALHGFLTRDGISPAAFAALARSELERYDTVALRSARVDAVEPIADGFRVQLAGGPAAEARTLVLATGVVDGLPALPGLDQCYGISAHHCPYCDGWEHRDMPLVVHGHGDTAADYSLRLLRWSGSITLCTNGPAGLGRESAATLARHGIGVREERIRQLDVVGGKLQRVVLEEGEPVEAGALFLCLGHELRSDIAAALGVALLESGVADSTRAGATNVDGVYAVGDASRDPQFVVTAAAEGTAAAVAINERLTRAALDGGRSPHPG